MRGKVIYHDKLTQTRFFLTSQIYNIYEGLFFLNLQQKTSSYNYNCM